MTVVRPRDTQTDGVCTYSTVLHCPFFVSQSSHFIAPGCLTFTGGIALRDCRNMKRAVLYTWFYLTLVFRASFGSHGTIL